MTVASRRRPQLVQSLGRRISEIGRMPLLGTVSYAPGSEEVRMSQTNSAQRVRALHETLVVEPDLAAALAAADGPVLLVDDLSDTGWTLAVAGAAAAAGRSSGGVSAGPRGSGVTGESSRRSGQGYQCHSG